jgi:hypothetical protein
MRRSIDRSIVSVVPLLVTVYLYYNTSRYRYLLVVVLVVTAGHVTMGKIAVKRLRALQLQRAQQQQKLDRFERPLICSGNASKSTSALTEDSECSNIEGKPMERGTSGVVVRVLVVLASTSINY